MKDRLPEFAQKYGSVLESYLAGGKEVILEFFAETLSSFETNGAPPAETIQRNRELLTVQAASAIENAHLYDEIHQRVNELAALSTVSQVINSTLDLEEMLTIITDVTTHLLGVAATSVVLRHEARDDLWYVTASGEGADFVRGKWLPPGHGIAGWVTQYGQPVMVPDVSQDPRFLDQFDRASGFTTRSMLSVPLQTKGQTIGAISAMNKENGPFNQNDLRLLRWLAAPAAIAIENVRLYKQAQQEITDRKRAEAALAAERALLARRVEERTAELSAANAELAKSARLKDEFLASMSHELRTPLNTILGKTEALQELVHGPVSEKQLKSLSSVQECGHHLLSLINDILDLSKIEAGKLELDIRPVSVESVCQASLRMVKGAAHKKQLEVGFTSTLDDTTMALRADERRLKQILVNLLSNAVKFTPEGGKIGLDVIGDAEQEVVHFTVWDTGIGIAPEDRGQLFQSFVQLDSSLSRQYVGTGLGLSLVHRMVELHGGGVSVESEVGQGSRLTVSLPWRQVAGEQEDKVGQAQSTNGGEARSAPPVPARSSAHSPLILLAEDNEHNIDTLLDYLPVQGYRVVVARNGEEAIARAREERPNVILMDIQMPGMNGLEAIRRLQAEANLATIPIIALTALAMPGDRERCLEAGADEYLSKPISLKRLVQLIETHYCQLPTHSPNKNGALP